MSNQKPNTENKKPHQSSSTPNQQISTPTIGNDKKNPAKPTETNTTTTPADSVFEDIELSDPAPQKKENEEADYEMIEKSDAPFSSYNSQPDHRWKYEDGKKKKKSEYEEDIFFAEARKREREERERWGEGGGRGT